MKKLAFIFLALFAYPMGNAIADPGFADELKAQMEAVGDTGCYEIYAVAADISPDMTFLLAVSDFGGGFPVEINSFPTPFTSFNSRQFGLSPRGTIFLSPDQFFCKQTVCTLWVRFPAFSDGFSGSSVLYQWVGDAMSTPQPFRQCI